MKLPSYQQLTKAQDAVVNLPTSESCLVTGPPGTGKTVVALHRTYQATKLNAERTHLLMFSNLLRQYTSKAASTLEIDTRINTFHKFMFDFHRRHLGCEAPMMPGKIYDFDWSAVLGTSLGKAKKCADLHLIIDEAQDLDKYFFLLASRLAAKMTVMADENQCMELSTTIEEIRQYASIPRDRVFLLTKNYRNSRPIAEFAAQFYVGLPTGIPELPTRTGPKAHVERHKSLEETVERIQRYFRNNDDQTIGVICSHKATQREIYKQLQTKLPALNVQNYSRSTSKAPKVDFSLPGVYLLHIRSCKGLEFDSVYMPEIQRLELGDDQTKIKMKLYVACSRAVDRLTISFTGSPPPILKIFNRDIGEWLID